MNQPEFPDNLPNGERYRHWHYNPVTVNAPNTVGIIFLGIVCIILLIILMRELKSRHQTNRS
jgi:Ni/Fe-hydrogenase subunit HybB-like protein